MSRKNPVFSDDPKAVEKLEAEIAMIERNVTAYKAINKIVRKYAGKDEAKGLAELEAAFPSFRNLGQFFKPDFAGRIGIPDYEFSNNSANLRRLKARIAAIKETA